MFPDEFVDFHSEAPQLHDMADAHDPLPHREGPELLELPLGDADLLTCNGPSSACPRRKQITAPFATDAKFLTTLPNDISLFDLGTARQ